MQGISMNYVEFLYSNHLLYLSFVYPIASHMT